MADQSLLTLKASGPQTTPALGNRGLSESGTQTRAETVPGPISAGQARAELVRFRREVVERELPGAEPNRCVLRDEIVDKLIKGGGDSTAAFMRVVPLFMRERVDPRQMRYLEDIYEIIGRISADQPSPPDGDDRGLGAPAFRPYREARLIGDVPRDVADCEPRSLINPILEIVRQEGPVHIEEIARRLQHRADGERAGRRVVETVSQACDLARGRGAIRNEGFFWRGAGPGAPRPRSRAKAGPTLRDIGMIAPSEIREAARLLVAEHQIVDKAEIVLRVAHALGYSHVTENISRTIGREVLKVMSHEAGKTSR